MLDIPQSSYLADGEGYAPPAKRQPQSEGDVGLPPGTEVFSADSHMSLTEDIWYDRFPAHLKDKAPRVWRADNVSHIGFDGKSMLHPVLVQVISQFEAKDGCHSGNLKARLADMDAEGVTKDLVFPACLTLLHWADFEIREQIFTAYNDYLAELQARAPGRFYGVGLINWWDKDGARRTLQQIKSLGIKTFLLPLNPGKDKTTGEPIDYTSTAMIPVWEEIEASGLPVSHHIGEGVPPKSERNNVATGFLQFVTPFRDMFGRYTFGGILDRHPSLQIGWFEGGISWVPGTIQDANHTYASYKHLLDTPIKHEPGWYWYNQMCASFMVDPLGLQLIDKIGIDRAMWSSDYPHNESSFGYSRTSLRQVVDAVGPENARKIVSENVKRFLKI